jgi:hypothetical protein
MLYTNSIITEKLSGTVHLANLSHLVIMSNRNGGMLGNRQCQCGLGIHSMLMRLIVC